MPTASLQSQGLPRRQDQTQITPTALHPLLLPPGATVQARKGGGPREWGLLVLGVGFHQRGHRSPEGPQQAEAGF